MGCAACGSKAVGQPSGCGNKGACQNGGCSRMNTYDWFAKNEIEDVEPFGIVEVSFKNGARKGFFRTKTNVNVSTGDFLVVNTGSGYDVGRMTLGGEMTRMQMRKKKVREDQVLNEIVRIANDRDIDRLKEAREREHKTLVRSRVIARDLGLTMKIGDIEYQSDLRKATFFYTADGRVDFRELVRTYAREFNVKVEMRQIGARQESARLGGLGSCGRELCCSTWLSDFKTVATSAARYQNLAINQTKLSGQCGRLKCCLNYELDTYIDALNDFPTKATKLKVGSVIAGLIKIDIFKEAMYYSYKNEKGRIMFVTVPVDRVSEIQAMNKKGEIPDTFLSEEDIELEEKLDFADVTGDIVLKEETKKRRNKRRKRYSKDKRQSKNQNSSKGKSDGNSNNKQDKKQGQGSAQNNTQSSSKNKKQNKGRNNQNRSHSKSNKEENKNAQQNQNNSNRNTGTGSQNKNDSSKNNSDRNSKRNNPQNNNRKNNSRNTPNDPKKPTNKTDQ